MGDRCHIEATSLLFCRITIFGPFLPAALKGIDLREAHLHQFLCHTGTGTLAGSGAVEDENFILRIFFSPGFYITGVFSNRTLNLHLTVCPILA